MSTHFSTAVFVQKTVNLPKQKAVLREFILSILKTEVNSRQPSCMWPGHHKNHHNYSGHFFHTLWIWEGIMWKVRLWDMVSDFDTWFWFRFDLRAGKKLFHFKNTLIKIKAVFTRPQESWRAHEINTFGTLGKRNWSITITPGSMPQLNVISHLPRRSEWARAIQRGKCQRDARIWKILKSEMSAQTSHQLPTGTLTSWLKVCRYHH